MSNYQEARQLFANDERRADISQRLYYYLMSMPTPAQIDRFLEIESKIGVRGEGAVLAAWIREHQTGERLPTKEVQALGLTIDQRVTRIRQGRGTERKRAS